MKKFIICTIILLMCGGIGAFKGLYDNKMLKNETGERIFSNASTEKIELDSLLENADVIAYAEVIDIKQYTQYDEYTVSVNKTKKGNVSQVMTIKNYLYDFNGVHTVTDYEKGNEYIFILQHIRNVYEDNYVIMNNAYIPLDDNKQCQIICEDICETDVVNYIEKYKLISNVGNGNEYSIEYIEDDSYSSVWTETPYIAKVRLIDMCRSTENVDVYVCTLIKNIKGVINTDDNNQILIPFFKNTVGEGEECVVCLNCETDDSVIYTLSSKNSVY